jgi:hypothetical protein
LHWFSDQALCPAVTTLHSSRPSVHVLQLKKSDSFESVHSAASFESADEQQAAAAGPNIKQAGTYATAPTYASR